MRMTVKLLYSSFVTLIELTCDGAEGGSRGAWCGGKTQKYVGGKMNGTQKVAIPTNILPENFPNFLTLATRK